MTKKLFTFKNNLKISRKQNFQPSQPSLEKLKLLYAGFYCKLEGAMWTHAGDYGRFWANGLKESKKFVLFKVF